MSAESLPHTISSPTGSTMLHQVTGVFDGMLPRGYIITSAKGQWGASNNTLEGDATRLNPVTFSSKQHPETRSLVATCMPLRVVCVAWSPWYDQTDSEM